MTAAARPMKNLAFSIPIRSRSDQRRSRKRWRLVRAAVVIGSIAWTSGCDRPTPASDETVSLPAVADAHPAAERVSRSLDDESAAARQELRRVIARYRSANTYRDRAVVRMVYHAAGEVQHDSAPLSVHYAAPDRLTLQAYSTHLHWRAGILQAFVDAPEVNRLDRQLLRRSFKRPNIEIDNLYQDPVVTHFASAGPAGPTPQIELLFGDNPLAGFFADGMRLAFGEEAVIDGHRCRCLLLDTEGAKCALWIDSREAIIRRIDLPSIELPGGRTDTAGVGKRVSRETSATVVLSVDFVDAEIDGPGDSPADPLPRQDIVTVDTLTLAPPSLASPLVGRQPEPFRLNCQTVRPGKESFDVTHNGSDREQTVLLWVADHSGSSLAIEQLAAFSDQLAPETRRRCRLVVVQAEPRDASPVLEAIRQSSLAWATDHEAIGRDRFSIEQAPALCVLGAGGTVHWAQSPVGPEMTTTLDGLLRDLYAGIDVGSRLREQYETELATYRVLLEDRRLD